MDKISERKPALADFLLKLLTGTQVAIVIAWIRPIDIDIAIIAIEVDVRHIAIQVAGTCFLPGFIHFTDNLLQDYLR